MSIGGWILLGLFFGVGLVIQASEDTPKPTPECYRVINNQTEWFPCEEL